MGVTEISCSQIMGSMTPALREKPTGDVEKGALFSMMLESKQQKCPYDYLAKDGVIEYNGVTFVCDYKKNSICLGDMTNPKEVLNISLPSGGNLKVNINNFGDLSKAAGMFSPADLNAIMRAIAQYNHCISKLNEIEEEENESVESATEQSDAGAETAGIVTEDNADMSFNDLFNTPGLKGNQIPVINQNVTSKNPNDGKITFENGDGQKCFQEHY